MSQEIVTSTNVSRRTRFRRAFATRHLFLHDGRVLRRVSLAARTQVMVAGLAAATLGLSAYGATQAATAVLGADPRETVAADQKVVAMRHELHRMAADLAETKRTAKQHVARVEQRQAMIAAVLSGAGEPEELANLAVPATIPARGAGQAIAATFEPVERRQAALAAAARQTTEQRYAATARELRRLGLRPERLVRGAMGGPYEPASTASAGADARADAQFRSLFMSWKKLDSLEEAVIAVPSMRPVAHMSFTSNFGVRSDPFRGTAAMHSGVDIPGPVGTPVYATADGVVNRAERAGGYGNLVELSHGKGIQTRYGHLSRILVEPNTKVTRGQLIGLMGSTGRSTGSHLHYEVRLDGRAVNPVPFLEQASILQVAQSQATPPSTPIALAGAR